MNKKLLAKELIEIAKILKADAAIQEADVINMIIDYENGKLDDEEKAEMFQGLIDNGLIHHLQGSYQKMANDYIRKGLCHG